MTQIDHTMNKRKFRPQKLNSPHLLKIPHCVAQSPFKAYTKREKPYVRKWEKKKSRRERNEKSSVNVNMHNFGVSFSLFTRFLHNFTLYKTLKPKMNSYAKKKKIVGRGEGSLQGTGEINTIPLPWQYWVLGKLFDASSEP